MVAAIASHYRSIEHLSLIHPGRCSHRHGDGGNFESFSSLCNLKTLHWVGLKASWDYISVLRDICKANEDHLTSLRLDFDPWHGSQATSTTRSDTQDARRSRPQSANMLVSGILSKIGTLAALKTLSIRAGSLLDVSRNYAEVLNICQLRSLHLHKCDESTNFLTGLAAAAEKKHIYLSLTDFELVAGSGDQYELCVGRFLNT